MSEIAGYRVLRRLGEGGMGSVHLAEAPDGQQVAIKVIRPQLLEREEFRERFRREVARAKTVPPFCTAEVIAADPDHDPPYLVIEYVDGPTLFQMVQESGPLRGAKLHSLAVGVATALVAIHGAGVIHRDLKPGNVLFSHGSIKVIDFGIARGVDADTGTLTTGNQVIGTIPYTSPERLGGAKALSPAADIFAWGAVVTFAATGRTPFPGDTPADTAISILSDPPDLEGLTEPLRDLVERALAKDPADRPTARELLDMLLLAAPTVPRAPIPVPVPPPADKPTTIEQGTTLRVAPRRRRATMAAAVTGTLLAGLAAVALVNGGWDYLAGASPAHTEPSLAQSPSQSAKPSPTASPTPGPAMVDGDLVPPGLRPMLRAPLTEPGHWRASETEGRGGCEFSDAGLTATLEPNAAVYRCQTAWFDQTTDFAAYVDVKTDGDSCATMWFRFQLKGSDIAGVSQPNGGYAVQVCGDEAFFISHEVNHVTLRTMRLDPAASQKETRIGVVARGHEFRFYQDGREIAVVDNGTYKMGRVELGIFKRNAQPREAYSATFSDLVVYGTSL